MAVHINANTQRLLINSGLFDHNAAYTAFAFIRLTTDLNAYGVIVTTDANDASFYSTDYFGVGSSGVRLIVYGANSSAYSEVDTGFDFTINAWYAFAAVRESATSARAWVAPMKGAGSFRGSALTTNMASRGAQSRFEYGGATASNLDPSRIQVAATKIWTRALTSAELQLEACRIRPVISTNLWAWHPLFVVGDVNDRSGNGRNWSAVGSPASADGPPIIW